MYQAVTTSSVSSSSNEPFTITGTIPAPRVQSNWSLGEFLTPQATGSIGSLFTGFGLVRGDGARPVVPHPTLALRSVPSGLAQAMLPPALPWSGHLSQHCSRPGCSEGDPAGCRARTESGMSIPSGREKPRYPPHGIYPWVMGAVVLLGKSFKAPRTPTDWSNTRTNIWSRDLGPTVDFRGCCHLLLSCQLHASHSPGPAAPRWPAAPQRSSGPTPLVTPSAGEGPSRQQRAAL